MVDTASRVSGRAVGVRKRAVSSYWNGGVVAACSVGVAVLGWRHRALSDDGLIFLRTVRQIVAGNGPVLNVEERAEANTSTLWQWLLVVVEFVTPGDLGFAAVVGGLLFTTAGVAVALDGGRRLHNPRGGRFLVPAGVLVLFAVPPFWDYSTTGLDSGLGTFWLGGCWWLLVRAYERGAPAPLLLGTSAWIGLGPLVRPDMAIASVAFFAALAAVAPRGWRGLGLRLAAAGVLPVGYEIFRAGYYGVLVPLPAVAKGAGAAEPGRGWRYVGDFVGPYALYVPALIGLLLLAAILMRRPPRRELVVLLTPLATAALIAAYVVWVGGDFMHGRMLLPPMFLALMPVMLLPFDLRVVTAAAAIAVWAVAVAGPWHPGAYERPSDKTTALIRTSDIELTGMHNADHVDDWTGTMEAIPDAIRAALAQREPVLLFFTPDQKTPYTMPLSPEFARKFRLSVQGGYLGVIGAVVPLDQRIVERWGLANTVAAHMEPVPEWRERWPGHRKDFGYTWMIAIDAAPGAALPPWPYAELDQNAIAAARRAMVCGDLKELLDSTREPMGVKRFWNNLTGAYDRTKLVIPRDPYEADRKFCAA